MEDKFRKIFDKAGSIKLGRFQFDDPDVDMLAVDENNYLEHLKVQPQAIYYFTSLLKQCERECDEMDRRYKYRQSEMYSDCASSLMRELDGKRPTVKEIEAYIYTKYEAELKRMEKSLDELREQRDSVSAFLDGLRQKSFALSSLNQLIIAGLLTPKDSITQEDIEAHQRRKEETTLNRARKIMSMRGTQQTDESEGQ